MIVTYRTVPYYTVSASMNCVCICVHVVELQKQQHTYFTSDL